jgi:Phage-related lysozyme (muraminidase)
MASFSSLIKHSKKFAALAAILGSVGAASIAVDFTAEHEGEVLTTYKDVAGVDTVCYGDTSPDMAIPGATYTREECLESLMDQLVQHAGPVAKCAPGVTKSPEMTAAFTSLAYNIGTGAFCRSTVVKRFKTGDYAGACGAMKMWNKAGGKESPGLNNRRGHEYTLCMKGVPAMIAGGAAQ